MTQTAWKPENTHGGGAVSVNNCGQSYKQFTLIIYESRVVIWGIFKSVMSLEP